MDYALNLAQWNLYPDAEKLLGAYVASLTSGKYLPEHRRVLHNRKISLTTQVKIAAYTQALNDTSFGHP